VVIDDDLGTRLERRDEVLENLDGVGRRVVVDNPAEEVNLELLACENPMPSL
jgi:hypothetical protein